MSRTEFLSAVMAAWSADDPWALLYYGTHFADLVDAHAPALDYVDAVVIEGDTVVVATRGAYEADRVALEARAGEVTSVLRGEDLLAGRVAADADRRPTPF